MTVRPYGGTARMGLLSTLVQETRRSLDLRLLLKRLFDPGETLSQRAVRGGLWVLGLRVVERLLRLVRLVVLGRILAPTDFGILGVALLAMSVLETFSEPGFLKALIQKKGDAEQYFDTAWTVQFLRGGLLWLILCIGAPGVGVFFDSPGSVAVVRALGGLELLRGAFNIGVVHFSKELEFSKLFLFQMTGTLTDFVVSVGAAILLRNVWALVLGQVAGTVVSLVFSYVVHPYRPSFKIDRCQLLELRDFGQWVFGSSVLVFLLNEGDDIVLGKMLGVTALGLYQMAYQISNLPATEVTHLISQVSFPAYSKLQDDPGKLREAYLQILQLTTFISIPLAIGIAAMAKTLTQVFVGEQWLPMVPALQILAFWGLIRSIGATFGPLFQAIGKPQFAAKLQFVKLFILGVLIYPLTARWGMEGTSWAVVLNALVVNPIAGYLVAKETQIKIREYVRLLSFPLYGSGLMFLALYLFNRFVSVTPMLFSFMLSVMVGVLTYGGSMYLFEMHSDYGAMQLIRASGRQLLHKQVRG